MRGLGAGRTTPASKPDRTDPRDLPELIAMQEQPSSSPDAAARIRANLRESARLLREAHHIEPDAQRTLADLVEELSEALDPACAPSTHEAHLAESSTHLVRALHQRHEGLIASARQRLAAAAARAEADAPVATGIARRLINALSDLGI
jgi:hypothetical protein